MDDILKNAQKIIEEDRNTDKFKKRAVYLFKILLRGLHNKYEQQEDSQIFFLFENVYNFCVQNLDTFEKKEEWKNFIINVKCKMFERRSKDVD